MITRIVAKALVFRSSAGVDHRVENARKTVELSERRKNPRAGREGTNSA